MPSRFRRMTLPLAEMPDLYRSADVMLHPTFHESFGNVYAEALAIGVPVVAHDYAVTRWIFGDGYPGLVDAADEQAITAAVTRAIEHGKPDALGRTAAAAERFSWRNIARQYRDFLVGVHDKHRLAGR
jgi:glycosyltransferase involved in cell wall biosynthesis